MLYRDLARLEEQGRHITLGVTGAGWMGSGFIRAVSRVPGMRVGVLADPDTGRARQALLDTGVEPARVVETGSPSQAADALRAGKPVVTADPALAAGLEQVDLVTDVTPSPASGAATALAGIRGGKNVVLVNIEADVAVGRALSREARRAGVLYSVSSGDEPGCLMELWDFVNALGYEPVVIGKGKNNPLQPLANPDTVAGAASRAGKDPFQVASYVDGTKTMFEMCCAANATGCLPMKRGMIGPEADLSTVSRVFALAVDGGVATAPYSVDFVQGSAMAGGVFATVRVQDRRIRDDLSYLKVGEGPYFTFFRPYHLWFLEAPLSLARAHLYGQATLVPLDEPVAEVLAVAKKSMRAGERVDDFGGYCFRGVIDRAGEARRINALPAALAPGARLKNPVWRDKIIAWDDVELDERSDLVRLRREQDAAV
ncbi:MAG: NAD(P)H-dependent oxidoreductase [Spirochaetota bacterium]